MDQVKKTGGLLLSGLSIVILFVLNWHFKVDSYRFLFDIGEIAVLTAALCHMQLLELRPQDQLLLTLSMLFGKVLLPFVYIPDIYMPRTLPFTLLLMLSVLFVEKTIHQKKTGYGCPVVFSAALCLLISWLFNNGEQRIYELHLRLERNIALLAALIYILAASVLVWLLSKQIAKAAGPTLVNLQAFSSKYTEIDASVLMVAILTLVCLMLTDMLPLAEFISGNLLQILWIALCAIIFIIQFVYIRVLIRSIFLKEEMRLQETDRETLIRYNHDLETNMESLRHVRHDIKNLFLTMGGFVEKSGDSQMRSFYQEHIVPFANQELEKCDLQAKLSQIQDESLKSFLYYKMMQGIEQGISIDLEIQLQGDCNFGIAQIDLIRILGILIDNAIEEAVGCKGAVAIQIKESPNEFTFSVRNATRPQTRERGVIAGTSDKGFGRGNGLLIVRKIIAKYKNVLLNSYFKEEDFVQLLRVSKG